MARKTTPSRKTTAARATRGAKAAVRKRATRPAPRKAPAKKTAKAKKPMKTAKTARKTATKRAAPTAKRAPRAKTATPARKRASAPKALVPATPSPASPHWTETLSDGTHVLIRPIGKQDAAIERAFIRRLSPESRRLRFLGQIGEPSDELIRALTDIDYKRDMAFVALVHRDGEKQEIGVSRYASSADGRQCECAITVSDEWRQKGLGTLLMRHLIDTARERGIRTMVSFDSAENLDMRDLAAYLGFERRADPTDPSQVVHTLRLG